jgi:serpin B
MHKAWGEVNEEGTEAAAATTVTIGVAAVGIPAQVPVFRADHPFLFLILETRSGSMLFLGRLADPTA